MLWLEVGPKPTNRRIRENQAMSPKNTSSGVYFACKTSNSSTCFDGDVESWKPLLVIWKAATSSQPSQRSQQSPIYGKVQMLWQMLLQELEALIGQLHPTCHASRETWMIFMSRKCSSNESTSMIRYLIMEGWWIHSCWDLYLVISYII